MSHLRSLASEARFRAAGLFGHGLLRGLFATVRIRTEGEESFLRFRREGTPVIFVIWHGHLLPLVYRHQGTGIVVLVGEHADGEYITRVIERIGFSTVRGSSTRGSIRGLKGLIRAARAGRDLALTVDGPRGPAHAFKPGALLAAQTVGLPLVPIAVGASARWRFPSWDAFVVPRPFSVVQIAYGEPRWVARDAGRDVLERTARELGHELDRLGSRCTQPPADGGPTWPGVLP